MDAIAQGVDLTPQPPRRKSPWTEEVIKFVGELCALNYSAAQIAGKLWTEFRMAVTRNAVIGITHRKKLDGRPHGVRVNPPRPRRVGKGDAGGAAANAVNAKARRLKMRARGHSAGIEEIIDAPPLAEITYPADAEIPAAQRCTIFTLTNTTCRWPVGDPQSPEFFFCGSADGVDCDGNRPYCALHSRRAYDDAGNTAAQMRWAASRATYYANR
jgi:GcrA cell cycle regulator